MRKDIELLAPVGDFECLKAAVQNGANSVYFGASLFNARASATNFDDDELEKVINYCALRNVRTHLTLNILIKDREFKDAVLLAKKAYELGIDALIVQDVGLAKFLMKLFPDLPIHASTQMTIHNLEGVQELEKLGYSRAVLSRELSIQEIEYICNNSNIEIETLKDIDFNEEIIEDGKTFEENSEIKAKAIEKYCKKNNIKYELILTDDAGLCIEKLNGEPGVYSARYAGPNATQKQILDKILDKMRQYENPEDRKCKFVCVLTGILKSGEKIVARGESKGIVAKEYKNLVVIDEEDLNNIE